MTTLILMIALVTPFGTLTLPPDLPTLKEECHIDGSFAARVEGRRRSGETRKDQLRETEFQLDHYYAGKVRKAFYQTMTKSVIDFVYARPRTDPDRMGRMVEGTCLRARTTR